jgi:hypothetical protein
MKKIILVFSISLLSGFILLFSCSKSKQDNPCGGDNRFKSTGLTINTVKIIGFDSIHSQYYFDTVKVLDTVSFDKLALKLTPIKSFYTSATFNYHYNFSFFNEAYACSPPIPYSDEQNGYIIITCEKDFDQVHKSGTNLANLFDVAILDSYKGIYYYRMSLQDYLALKPNTKDELILFLNQAPEKTDDYIFKIEYGRTLGTDEKVFVVNSVDVSIPKK